MGSEEGVAALNECVLLLSLVQLAKVLRQHLAIANHLFSLEMETNSARRKQDLPAAESAFR